ncbi:MAG: hypothetical protein JW715_06310 [Sedimentisphaerales bacterium]|nr:hypothetical protein [Sedimentisphaerales bacterium]
MIFANYPGHFIVALILVISAGLVVFAFQCRQIQKEKNKSYRFLLMGLRYASILILFLILWNPSRSILIDEITRNSVLVFFDTSRSMSVIEEEGTSRLDKAVNVFKENFRPTNKNGPEYKILGFDDHVYHSGSTQLLQKWGNRTDIQNIFTAIGKYDIAESENQNKNKQKSGNDVAAEHNNSQIRQAAKGVVVFTDGRADDQSLAGYIPLVRNDFPIVIVGIGSKKPTTDIEIKSLKSPVKASIDSVYNVEVVVSGINPGKNPVTVELLADDEIIGTNQIDPENFIQESSSEKKKDVTVKFTANADSLGSHKLLAKACTVQNEINQANNIRGAMVKVVEADKLRVLFYTQAANFNVGKVRQVLARDNRIQLDLGLDAIKTVGLSADVSKKLGYVRLPENREGLNKYDIIILGHCLLDNLTNEQIHGLYSFVAQRGGGLILLPGRGDFGPGDWKNTEIQALFPVIFEQNDSKLWPPNACRIELTPEASHSNIISPDDLDRFDTDISAFYKIAKTKPAASTYATSGGIPLVTLHRVGRGKVCLLNISRLFMLYNEDEQGGLLYKLISGLISNIATTSGPAAGIELFVERADNQDNKIKFSAHVCDSSFIPVEHANVLLNIEEQVLVMESSGKGYYVTESDNINTDTVIATAQAETGGVFLGEKTIAVNLPPRRTEMSETQLNETFMQNLAEHIKGKYIHADDIDKNITEIFEAQTHIGTTRRMTSIWPRWLLFITLCMTLSMEWFLRRKKGLV